MTIVANCTQASGRPSWAPIEHVEIGGIRVALAGRTELTAAMVHDCTRQWRGARAHPRLILDSNGHAVSLYPRDGAYREAIDNADVVHADGGFLVLLSRVLTGHTIRDRSATTDMIHDFAIAAEKNDLSFFLLGSDEAENERCANVLQAMYPGLNICGRQHGYFEDRDEGEIIDRINSLEPDVLWVGLGKPREQSFVFRNRARLKSGWIVTCGGCFNYISGKYSRAPSWMQRLNLEWLFRSLTEPRLFWRYLTTSPHAAWRVLTNIDRKRYCDAKKASATIR